jgi:hypothetical protein
MALSRVQALAYVNELYGALATALQKPLTDSSDGWAGTLDRSWRTLGVATGTDVPDGQEPKAEAVLRYQATGRLLAVAAAKQDATGGEVGVTSTRSQWFKQAEALHKLAIAELSGYDVSVVEDQVSAAVFGRYAVQDPAPWMEKDWVS